MNVAVIIIAKDAQNTLAGCLDSVAGLTDDILVVIDDRTVDTTAQIAKDHNAKILQHKFIDFSDQRNWAATMVSHDWVFSLDADEEASPELVTAIKSLPNQPIFAAFNIPRKNIIFSKIINYTNWDPNGLVRLYDKNRCRWQGVVHESLITSGGIDQLYDPIIHYNYSTVDQFMQKQNTYSTQAAGSQTFSYVRFFLDPLVDFVRRYFIHTGFLDGWHGLFLSYLMVIFHLSVWIKVWQKSNSIQH
jgi:glycosyltransferase involved in cell wall biosynthesis